MMNKLQMVRCIELEKLAKDSIEGMSNEEFANEKMFCFERDDGFIMGIKATTQEVARWILSST